MSRRLAWPNALTCLAVRMASTVLDLHRDRAARVRPTLVAEVPRHNELRPKRFDMVDRAPFERREAVEDQQWQGMD
jgi:hypothetical protein